MRSPTFAMLLAAASIGAAELREHVERGGTVSFGDGRTVTVETTTLETPDETAVWRHALVRLRFLDAKGTLLFQETFPSSYTKGTGFDEETDADSIIEVRGGSRRFALVPLGVSPSAPSAGPTFAVYGFDRRGRFRRLGAPLAGSGEVIRNPKEEHAIVLREGKYLDVSEWTGNFTLIVPYAFNEEREGFELANACGRIEVDPQPPSEGEVALYRAREPRLGSRAVKVRATSTITFLDGCWGPHPSRPDERTAWLRVRIDGEEGWSPAEGLATLGLPDAG